MMINGQQVLRHWVDAGIFPNRCEGGTNLIAMETLASGVPVVLSANTGHLDLIQRACPLNGTQRAGCIPLRKQRGIKSGTQSSSINPYQGWGESDVDEAAEALDLLSRNSRLAEELGHNGANMIKTTLTWNHTRRRLSRVLQDLKQATS